MRSSILVVTLLSAIIVSPSDALASGYIYVYKQPDGNYLFTDRGVVRKNYRLVRRLISPSGHASCTGVSTTSMLSQTRAYTHSIEKIALADHLDPLLISAIVSVESCYDAHAVSSAGARGLMQLMPTTAKQMGVQQLYNPKSNLDAGMRYFKSLMNQFSDNVRLALAAYNAGPAAVIKYHGIPPYPQTEVYVARVMRHYRYLLSDPSN